MERGYNRVLALDVFRTGQITKQIVGGQKRSEEMQRAKNMRLGYMGHLTLIAEEVVKFSENIPPLTEEVVMKDVLDEEWVRYVEQTLSETRERDNAILGGIRPEMTIGGQRQSSQGGFNDSFDSSADFGNGDFGSGFQAFDMVGGGEHASGGVFNIGGQGNALLSGGGSGFGSSSDDEEEEEELDQDDQEERMAGRVAEGETENVGGHDFFAEIDL